MTDNSDDDDGGDDDRIDQELTKQPDCGQFEYLQSIVEQFRSTPAPGMGPTTIMTHTYTHRKRKQSRNRTRRDEQQRTTANVSSNRSASFVRAAIHMYELGTSDA